MAKKSTRHRRIGRATAAVGSGAARLASRKTGSARTGRGKPGGGAVLRRKPSADAAIEINRRSKASKKRNANAAGRSKAAAAARAANKYVVTVRIAESSAGGALRTRFARNLALRVPRPTADGQRSELSVKGDCRLFSALGHPQRIKLLATLLAGSATYKELRLATGLLAGPLYHHLDELRAAGLIGPRRRDIYELTLNGTNAFLAALCFEGFGGGMKSQRPISKTRRRTLD